MKQFKEDFLIGAATAAHQVEGNNVNSDYWVLENIPGSAYQEPSMDAVDHYNRYREDIDLLAEAGMNAYRFSIEWARVEPENGIFEESEIEHYREVLQYCHKKAVTPVVTLHHFSSPKWLMTEGGWESRDTIAYFGRYCRYVVERLGNLIPYICTINEANMGVQLTRLIADMMKKMAEIHDVQVGVNLEQKEKQSAYQKAVEEAFGIPADQVQVFLSPRSAEGDALIIECHKTARGIIRELHPEIKVGITLSLYDYQAEPGGEEQVAKLWEEDFLHYLSAIHDDDFLGIQNYTRKRFGKEGKMEPAPDAKMTDAGNEYYPQSLAGVIRYVADHWEKEILVTEHGVATENDQDRAAFIGEALEGLYACVEEGIPVSGYLHWSLLDNFEWQVGYSRKFGLIAVDRTTQERLPKPSLTLLGNIKKKGF